MKTTSICDMEIRLSDLKDKQVTTVSGERLGFISNVILDSSSGELKTLVISSEGEIPEGYHCLLYTSPSPRDRQKSRMPSSA